MYIKQYSGLCNIFNTQNNTQAYNITYIEQYTDIQHNIHTYTQANLNSISCIEQCIQCAVQRNRAIYTGLTAYTEICVHHRNYGVCGLMIKACITGLMA